MRFVCLDLIQKGQFTNMDLPLFTDIYKVTNENLDSINDKNSDVLINRKIVKSKSSFDVFYGKSYLSNYKKCFPVPAGLKSLADYITFSGITITANFSISSVYKWNIKKLGAIYSHCWFTIMTDSGIQFVSPKRSTSAKIYKFKFEQCEDRQYSNLVPNYSGETTGDYFIGPDGDTVLSNIIDSTLKGMAVNKEKSMNDRISYVLGSDANLLDVMIEEGTGINYVIISKKEQPNNKWLVQAVKESNETLSFSGPNIITLDTNIISTVGSSGAIANADTKIDAGLLVGANSLTAGSVVRFIISGTCTSSAAGLQVFKIRFGQNNTTGDTQEATLTFAAATSGSNIPFRLVLEMTIRTIGATGTVYGYGSLTNGDGATTGIYTKATTVAALGNLANINTTLWGYLGLSYISGHANTACTFQQVITEVIRA